MLGKHKQLFFFQKSILCNDICKCMFQWHGIWTRETPPHAFYIYSINVQKVVERQA